MQLQQRLTKKEKLFSIALFSVLLLLLAAGTLFDKAISLKIADTANAFGRFLEIWAEPPSLIMVAFSFAMCAVFRFRERRPHAVLQTVLCTVGCVVACASTVYRTAQYYCGADAGRAGALGLIAAITVVLSILLIFLSTRIEQKTLRAMFPAMLFVITVALCTLVIVSAMKTLWGRIRFRDMAALGDSLLDGFMPWYRPQGVTGYNSFPSGHTANAVILFSATYYLNRLEKPRAAFSSKILVICWVSVVMISRILCGAHFLSDVVCGAIITAAITLAVKIWLYARLEHAFSDGKS